MDAPETPTKKDAVEVFFASLAALIATVRAKTPPSSEDPRWDDLERLSLVRSDRDVFALGFYGTPLQGTRDVLRRAFLGLWDQTRPPSYDKSEWKLLETMIFGKLNRYSDASFD